MQYEKAPGFDGIDPPKTPYDKAPGYGQYGSLNPLQQPTESGRLSHNYIAQSDLQNYMAGQQSGFELFGKAAAQTLSEGILGTVEAASYLGDWEQAWDKLHGDEKEYTNWLADAMKQGKQGVTDATKVFQTSEDRQEGFNPGSATWWAANSPQAIGSSLALLVPGLGVAGAAGKLATMIGMGAKGAKIAAGISATVASRYAEATMEANGVYEKALQKGASPEAAGEAASKAWNTNWVFALQDFTQYMPLIKGFSSAAKGGIGKTIAELISTPITEAAEEAGQFIVSEEAVKSATETNVDYFGKGFSNRLSDYLDDPEIKSSALLGAMGGTAFAGAGAIADTFEKHGEALGQKVGDTAKEGASWVKSQLGKIVNRGLQKERANYSGDTATSDYIDNVTFGQLIVDHTTRGTLPKLKADLEELDKQQDLPSEAREGLRQKKEDVDFMINEQSKLKAAGVNTQLHQPIMMAKLEAKQLGRLETSITKDLTKLENEVVSSKELDPNASEIKKLQLTANAYTRLAQTNPQYSPQAAEAVKAYETAIANPMVAIALPNLQEALTTSHDDELAEKTFQLVSTKEKSKIIKNDLFKLTTPQGQNQKLQEIQAKKAEQAIDTLVNDPSTTKEQLQKAVATNPSPSSLEKINNRLKQITEAKQVENKQSVDKAVESEVSTPTAEEQMPDEMFTEEYPGDFAPEDQAPSTDQELQAQLGNWLAAKDVQATVNRMTAETPTPAEVPPTASIEKQADTIQRVKDTNTVATRLKVIAGNWITKEGKQVFEPTLDANGIEIPQQYTDNRTGRRVAVEEVFEVEPKSGRLYADTPLLKEGDKIVLKVENDFPYTLTPGFKPTGEENYVINVYRSSSDGKAIGKPITQLPSADSPGENDPTALKNLRDLVIKSKDQKLETNIASKNVGSVRNSPNNHSLEIFNNDFVGEEYKKIPTNPILALAKLNGELSIPNAAAMRGMTPATLEQIEDLKVLPRGTEPSRGSRYVLRTNPVGNLQLVQLQGRKVNQAEIDWVKKNIAEYITNGDIETLSEVFYVEKGSVGLFKQKASGRDITRKSGRQLILIEGTKGAKDVLVPMGNKQWISVNPANLTSLGANQPFLFRRISKDGTWTSDVYSSTKLEPTEVQGIVDSYNSLISGAFRNMREESINSELPYTDLATGTQYPNYFDFLVKTETATAKVPGSPTIGHGEDNSYSFHNVGVRINATINPVSVEQKEDLDTDIIIKDEQEVPKPDTEVQSQNPIEDYYDTKFRKATNLEGFKTISQKELDWFTEHIGQDSIELARDIDRIISKGGVEAFGLYHNALVRVAQFAETGTTYHEAFHLFLDPNLGLITEAQRDKILKGTDEETLAEDFRLYMLSGGKKTVNKEHKNIFRRIYEAIKRILGLRTPIEKLFEDLSSRVVTAEQRAFMSKIRSGQALGSVITDEQTRLLPGFIRYAQQIEATNVSAYQIMNYAWNVAKQTGLPVEEILQTKADSSGETVLDSSFNLLRGKHKTDYDRIHAILRSKRSQEDAIRHDSYLAMGVVDTIENPDTQDTAALGRWDDTPTDLQVETGFKTEVIKAFAQFGFTIQLKDGTVYQQVGDGTGEEAEGTGETAGEVEEITDTITKDEVHGIDITMKDPSKNISQRLKLFLASIPDPEYKSVYGLAVPIEFNKVFTNLSAKLADSPVPMAELANIYKGDPVLTAVYNRIAEEAAEGNTTITNEFNSRFNLTETNFVSFVEEYQNGESVLKLMDTNRNSADRAIASLWKDNLISKGLLKRSGEVNLATTTIFANRVDKIRQAYTASKASKNTMPYSQLKAEFTGVLKDMGIVLPEQVWTELEQGKVNARNATVTNWFFGKQRNSLENMFENMKENGILEGTTVIDVLARRARSYMNVGGADTFLDEKNNQRYPINLPSALSDMINQVKARGEEMYKYYMQDKFYTNNKFVELMKDPIAVAELRVLNPSAYRKGQADPKSFEDRTQADSIITRLGAYNNNNSKSFGIIYVGTHEAKQKQSLIPLKKYNTPTEARTFLTEVLRGTVESEVTRIQRLEQSSTLQRGEGQPKFMDSNPLPTEIKDFSSKGKQFLYMPSLNAIPNLASSLREGDVSHEEFTQAQTAKDAAIQTFIDDQYQSFLEQLDKLGVISLEVVEGKNNITNELIPESLFNKKQADTYLREFFYNDFAWRHEMSKVFNGDIAFYKSDDDYYKRGYQTVTPGTKPFSDPSNPTTLVTAIYPKMPKVNSFDYLASLAHIVDKNVSAEDIQKHYEGEKASKKPIVQKLADFHRIDNGADSQTLITVDGWRKIMEPLGDWTKKHQKLYDFAWKKGLTVNQAINQTPMTPVEAKQWRKLAIDVATQPIKPFQFSERFITLANGEKMLVKEQYKDSRAALNPEFALRHPGYRAMLDYMHANGIEVMVNADAVKVGSYGIVDLSKPVQEWQKRVNSLNDLRLPQLNNNKTKTEASGSQLHKLILGNVERSAKYNVPGVGERSGQYVIEEYGEQWSEVHKRDSASLKKKLGITGDSFSLSKDKAQRGKQMFRLKTLLEQELMSRNLNENYADAIRIVLDEMNKPRFNVSLAFPNYASRFVGVLTNMFKKTFLNPKSPGFVGVDMAELVSGQVPNEGLNFLRNEDGKIIEAEVGMPVSFFNKIGLNFKDNVDKKTNKIIWEPLSKAQKSALQGILYRIPTSNKSSAIPIRIAMVIPPAQGQVVMVPPEFLTQQGLDFDYDKSQVMLRVLDKEGKVDEESPETKIFDLAWSILTSPQHFEEVMTALTSKNLKAISDKFKAKDTTRWMSPMNPARDVIAEDQNRDAKRMIGIFSRGNTAHAVIQTIKDYVHVGANFGIDIQTTSGYKLDKLGEVYDSDGKLISENFGEYQSAALDSGKDPLLYYLSTNKTTSPLVVRMLLSGSSQSLLNDFLNQPILKEWTKELQRTGGGNVDNAFSAIYESYPGIRTLMVDFLDGSKKMRLTEDGLSKSLDINPKDDLALSARILAEFQKVLETSKTVSKLTNVLSIDTFSDMTGPESLEAFINQTVDLQDKKSEIFLDPRIFDLDKAPKESKRLASFFNYSIKDAIHLVSQFYPYLNSSYVHVKQVLAITLGSVSLSEKSTIKALNQFLDFYNMEVNSAISPVLDKLAPNPRERWLYSNPDKSMFVYLESVIAKYPALNKNKFVSGLRTSYSKPEGVQMIGSANSSSRVNKTELTKAWRDMMLNTNKDIKTLAYDLVRFSIYTSGFSFNTRSFVDLIPNDFWVENGIAEAHYKILEGLNPVFGEELSSTRLDAEGASRSFIRHNFRSLDEVKELYVKWSDKGIQSQLVSPVVDLETRHISSFIIPGDSSLRKRNDLGNFVKIKTKVTIKGKRVDDYRLYEADPNDYTKFKEVQPLGESRAYFEIQGDGRNVSNVPMNKFHGSPDPFNTKEKKKEPPATDEGTSELPDCSK